MKKTIIYFVSEDWYFCSHRLPVARSALNNGYRVVVITKVNRHADIIKSEGFELYPIAISRGGINPIKDIKTIISLYKCYKKYSPNIIGITCKGSCKLFKDTLLKVALFFAIHKELISIVR